jgi:quinol monooxygenase YgiN
MSVARSAFAALATVFSVIDDKKCHQHDVSRLSEAVWLFVESWVDLEVILAHANTYHLSTGFVQQTQTHLSRKTCHIDRHIFKLTQASNAFKVFEIG